MKSSRSSWAAFRRRRLQLWSRIEVSTVIATSGSERSTTSFVATAASQLGFSTSASRGHVQKMRVHRGKMKDSTKRGQSCQKCHIRLFVVDREDVEFISVS